MESPRDVVVGQATAGGASEAGSGTAAAGAPPRDLPSNELQVQFVLNEHSYLGESIRYADQKAGFIFAFAAGALALAFGQGLYTSVLREPLAWSAQHAVSGLGLVFLLAACGASVFSFLPRLSTGKGEGLIFWSHVLAHGTHDRYSSAVSARSEVDLVAELTAHCFDLATIAERKYKLAKWGVWAAMAGVAFTLLNIAVKSSSDVPAPSSSVTRIVSEAVALDAALEVGISSDEMRRRLTDFRIALSGSGERSEPSNTDAVVRCFSEPYRLLLEHSARVDDTSLPIPAVAATSKPPTVSGIQQTAQERQQLVSTARNQLQKCLRDAQTARLVEPGQNRR